MEERRLLSDTDHEDYLDSIAVRCADRAWIRKDPVRNEEEGSKNASPLPPSTTSASESKPTDVQAHVGSVAAQGDSLEQFRYCRLLDGEEGSHECCDVLLRANACDGDEYDRVDNGRTKTPAKKSSSMFMALLSILVIFAQVGIVVMQPAVQGSLNPHIVCGQSGHLGGIYFFILFSNTCFVLLFAMILLLFPSLRKHSLLVCQVPCRVYFAAGLSCTLGIFLSMYSSPASRTPVFIQPLLTTAIVPMTVVLRFILLHKGLSKGQLICALATVVGVLIAMEPILFGIDSHDSGSNQQSTSHAVIFSCVFFLSFTPFALQSIIVEGALKTTWCDSRGRAKIVKPLPFIFWMNFCALLCAAPLFFIDILPWFGGSRNFKEFSSSMKSGFLCMFGSTQNRPPDSNCTAKYVNNSSDLPTFNPDMHCTTAILRMWLYIIMLTTTSICTPLLIKSSQGAVFTSLVVILSAPVGSVFWMLVKLDKHSAFHWQPAFTESSAYTFFGLLITVPAVAIFQYLQNRTERKRKSYHIQFEATCSDEKS